MFDALLNLQANGAPTSEVRRRSAAADIILVNAQQLWSGTATTAELRILSFAPRYLLFFTCLRAPSRLV
jgi:hypothetical protein